MSEISLTAIVKRELDSYSSETYKEFEADVVFGEDKVASIHLGNLIKGLKGANDDYEKNKVITREKRRISFNVESQKNLMSNYLENGFEFFRQIGEKNLTVSWKDLIERICPDKNTRDFLRGINSNTQKDLLFTEESTYIPLYEIKGGINAVENLIKERPIDKSGARLEKYCYQSYPDFKIKIGQKNFDFSNIGTNSDAVKYAQLIDKFLKS